MLYDDLMIEFAPCVGHLGPVALDRVRLAPSVSALSDAASVASSQTGSDSGAQPEAVVSRTWQVALEVLSSPSRAHSLTT